MLDGVMGWPGTGPNVWLRSWGTVGSHVPNRWQFPENFGKWVLLPRRSLNAFPCVPFDPSHTFPFVGLLDGVVVGNGPKCVVTKVGGHQVPEFPMGFSFQGNLVNK